jgi:hypothetical protein
MNLFYMHMKEQKRDGPYNNHRQNNVNNYFVFINIIK